MCHFVFEVTSVTKLPCLSHSLHAACTTRGDTSVTTHFLPSEIRTCRTDAMFCLHSPDLNEVLVHLCFSLLRVITSDVYIYGVATKWTVFLSL